MFRLAAERADIEVVGINDLIDVDYMAYMLKYDSTHGRFQGEISSTENSFTVNGKVVKCFAEKDPAKKAALIDKLMAVYDQRIKYFGDDSRYGKDCFTRVILSQYATENIQPIMCFAQNHLLTYHFSMILDWSN